MRISGPSARSIGVGFAFLSMLLILIAVPAVAGSPATALPTPGPAPLGTVQAGSALPGHAPAIDFSPTVTQFVPSLAHKYDPRLPYLDDYSDPSSGWYTADTGNTLWAYQGGEYEIMMRNAGWWAGAVCPLPWLTDYSVEADMRRPLDATSSYGLIFGWQSWSRYYLFLVSPDYRMFTILRQNSGWTTVVDWTQSTAIAPLSETNHLQIERIGGHINAYVNGQQVASVDDFAYLGSLQVGLYAEAGSAAPDIVYFDNFGVQIR